MQNLDEKLANVHDGACTALQENTPVKQEGKRKARRKLISPKEEKESLKGTVLKNCPTDPHYVLHSQNPAECPTVNTLSGFSCGVSQKGMLQNKQKIRVDFKVCLEVLI